MTADARYDQIADVYAAQGPDSYEAGPEVALLELIGAVRGLRALDMACGHGRISRELARRGAMVTGIDLSAGLLDKARDAEERQPLGITYLLSDVTSAATLPGESFDVVACHFGLSDIDDLDGALATVARALVPGGSFVGGYFEEGWWRTTASRSTLRQQVGANHRTLSTYLNALTAHGLPPEGLAEPAPPAEWTDAAPDRDPVPIFLVGRCRAYGHGHE